MTRTAISIAAIAFAITGLTGAAIAKPVHKMSKANQTTAQLNQQQLQGTPMTNAGSEPGMASGMTNDTTAGTMNNDTSATGMAPLPPATNDQGANAYVNPDPNAATTTNTDTPADDSANATGSPDTSGYTGTTNNSVTTGTSSSSSSSDANTSTPNPAIE